MPSPSLSLHECTGVPYDHMGMALLLLLLAKERGGMWEEALYGMGGMGRER